MHLPRASLISRAGAVGVLAGLGRCRMAATQAAGMAKLPQRERAILQDALLLTLAGLWICGTFRLQPAR